MLGATAPRLARRAGRRRPGRQRCRGEAPGFTLIEGLIAATLLGVIAMGVMPLFNRAMINNEAGSEYSEINNAARGRLEEFSQLPFNSEPLTLLTGSDRVYDQYFSRNDRQWKPGTETDAAAAGDLALMTRTTTVRQFNVNDLTNPLDSTASLGSIQIKEITVLVASTRDAGPLGTGKQLTLRLFRSR